MLLSLLLLLASAAGLFAELYVAHATALLSARADSTAAIVAYRRAISLAPYAARPQSELAWALLRQGRAESARIAIVLALKRAPADADLWLKSSVMQLGCAPCYSQLAASARRVNALAPQQADAQSRQARLALAQWPYANPATQAEWRHSIQQASGNLEFQHGIMRGGISVAACNELTDALTVLIEVCRGR